MNKSDAKCLWYDSRLRATVIVFRGTYEPGKKICYPNMFCGILGTVVYKSGMGTYTAVFKDNNAIWS